MPLLPLAALAALLLAAVVPPAAPAADARAPEATLAAADTIVLTRDELQFSTNRLLIPVAGVELSEIRDSFNAPRSGGRVHRSIDIMAPMGTPVLAIADGEVTRRSRNRLGGITLYLTSPDGEYRFYYAHLQRYDPRATVGTLVQVLIYAIIVAGGVAALSEIWGELQRAAGATERLVELLTTVDAVQDVDAPAALPTPVQGHIRFEDVSFAYPARPGTQALDHVDL
ncbi:MAG: peptidoglycan DD-metalloendopeptidase family protein, partial [Bacteroidota bacterium]